jgi:hypothetical protein
MTLTSINSPADLRKLSREELPPLADELRQFILDSVSKTGGHLSSNLGTVELAIALHSKVFLVFHTELKVNLMPSVQGIHLPVFLLQWEWRVHFKRRVNATLH